VAPTACQPPVNFWAFHAENSHESLVSFMLGGRLWQPEFPTHPPLSYSNCIMLYTLQQCVCVCYLCKPAGLPAYTAWQRWNTGENLVDVKCWLSPEHTTRFYCMSVTLYFSLRVLARSATCRWWYQQSTY